MQAHRKKQVKNSISRMFFTGLAVLLQIAWFVYLPFATIAYFSVANIVFQVIAFVIALKIYSRYEVTAFKLPWILLILGLPILGIAFYLLFGHKQLPRKVRRQFAEIDALLANEMSQDEAIFTALRQENALIANECQYIKGRRQFPLFTNTDVIFYPEAAQGFEAQLADLAKAKRFIFMEYHAIEEAESFARLQALLEQKVKEGVEVRILYDDIGSFVFIDKGFIKRMEALGIACRVFNPVVPFINLFMNNRDHRKITVIDGEIGFTGGYNLADEYFNITHPFGHWKDTGIRLQGDAVKSLTVMFLELWNAMKKSDTDFLQYLPESTYTARERTFVQPYADRPMDFEPLAENVYLNMIKTARHKLYITTPYLIISDEMSRELTLAAMRGVDVRILTPGIPDKKLIFRVTRSYYAGLIRGGVRIFEYTPGFLHAKQMLCDDESAIVGTINLDFRSLYHHFENGVFLYSCSAINDIAKDFDQMIAVSEEVTEKYAQNKQRAPRLTECFLRLLAPLL